MKKEDPGKKSPSLQDTDLARNSREGRDRENSRREGPGSGSESHDHGNRSGEDRGDRSSSRFQRTKHRHEHSHEYGQSWSIAAALLDGPKTFDELAEYFRIMARRFGIFVDILDRSKDLEKNGETAARSGFVPRSSDQARRRSSLKDRELTEQRSSGLHPRSGLESRQLTASLARSLEFLLQREWIVRREDHYHLTEAGRVQAHIMLRDLERGGRFIDTSTRPETVSKVTLIVHFVLAAIKLPAALLSGSVGLLNDALDTLMDGISSLFVFFGVRSGREKEVSYILLVFMGITGLYSLYEAVSRFFRPQPLSADLTAFAAVAVSGVLCALLWVYQKYAGLKHSCVPLIAQSVDSRNHVIVAGGVAAGLVAVFFRFPLLDRFVGLTVSILILKGAAELLIDLLRSSGEEEVDLSRYGFSRLDRNRTRQMVRWFLFEIEKGRITSREEMLEEARIATDFSRIASLRALGLDTQPGQEEKIREAAEEVFSRGFVEEVANPAGLSSALSNSGPEDFLENGLSSGGPESHSPSKEAPGSRPARLSLTPEGEEELRRALSDSWSFSGRPATSGTRSVPLRMLGGFLRLAASAVLFAAIFTLGRFLIELLPSFDIWSYVKGYAGRMAEIGGSAGPSGSAVGSTAGYDMTGISGIFFFISSLFSQGFRVGPFLIRGTQLLCMIVGFVLYHAGRNLMHWARHTLRHARMHGRRRGSSAGGEKDRPLFLITEGPFVRMRHPMYAGFVLSSLGIGIGLYSGYTLIWAAPAVLIQLISTVVEERRLSQWFGREYRDYIRRVRRKFFSWWGWAVLILLYAAAWAGV